MCERVGSGDSGFGAFAVGVRCVRRRGSVRSPSGFGAFAVGVRCVRRRGSVRSPSGFLSDGTQGDRKQRSPGLVEFIGYRRFAYVA